MLPEATLRGKKVIVKKNIDLLKTGKFGKLLKNGKTLLLTALEALYLVDKNKIIIKDKKGKEFSFEELIKYFIKYDKNIFPKYLIYRDLRDRGYYVIDGYGHDIDLLIYDRGTYPDKPAKYRIIGIDEGKPIKIIKILNELKSTLMSKKELKIALIERKGDIIYYTVSLLNGGRIDEN